MKILIIAGSFKIGGAERISINTGEELIRRGYDVYFVLQRPIFEIPNSIPKDKIFVLRKKKSQNAIYKIYALFVGIMALSLRIKPDRVMAFSRFSSFLANFTFRTKIIARFDANPYRLSKKQRRWADVVIRSPFIKRVIVPSSGMLKALQIARPSFSRTFKVIPNSINIQNVLDKVNEHSVQYDFEYITAMGRLSRQKNFELLIKAYDKSEIRGKLKLIIIGEGKHRPVLEDLIAQLNLKDEVILVGRLSNPFPTIKNSRFFVNPSLYESFCNVILEALVLSKPVIATDCDYGPSDIIIDRVNGLLIKSDDLDAMIRSLNELGTDNSLLKLLEENAKQSADKFNIIDVGDMWEKTIKEI